MLDFKRLDQCYDNSIKSGDVLEVTDETKYVFFSDIHRGDNSLADEFAHNQIIYTHAIESYFDGGYTYFELGDGDELWEYKNFSKIRSAHSDIFLLLKNFFDENRFYYFFGNHNMVFKKKAKTETMLKEYYDEYTDTVEELFPGIDVKESMILRDSVTGKEILMIHGHQGDFTNDQAWFVSAFLVKVFWRYMHKLGFHNPASPANSRVKRHKIEKTYSKWIRARHLGILCGHTHRPKLPEEQDSAYLNTGCCIHPRGITGIELIGREFYLVHWYVKAVSRGHLAIKKKIVRGPLSFDDLML